VFNAGLSFMQESHAQRALAVLRRRLTIQVRVRRDATWQRLPAERLVPGDLIHLRVGDMVPADARLSDGNVLIDHSAVTDESSPIEAGAGYTTYTGGLIKRGEATAVVIATGNHTYFGKTAELVRQAKAAGHLQQMIFTIVKCLVAFDVVLASFVLVYALSAGMGAGDILPFCLMLLVASIPVALPATFTLASALGAQELAHSGVLVSRLSAIRGSRSDGCVGSGQNRYTHEERAISRDHKPQDALHRGGSNPLCGARLRRRNTRPDRPRDSGSSP